MGYAGRPGRHWPGLVHHFASVVGAVLSIAILATGVSVGVAHAEISCAPAQEQTKNGYPQRAIAFVNDANAGLTTDTAKSCLNERADAVAQQQRAEALALEAEELASDDADKDTRKKAKTKAENAISLDHENTRARAIIDATDPPAKSWWQKIAKGWETFTERVLTPLGKVAAPTAALIAGLLLVARIAATLRTSWPHKRSAAYARWQLVWGSIVICFFSAALVGLFSGMIPELTALTRYIVYAALAAVLCVGVGLTASGLAQRLRVAVDVRADGKSDEQATAHVQALLEQFGASPPKGIERPVGPDVQALESLLTSVETGWLATIKTALGALTGWTPWRMIVDHTQSSNVTVTITRNGHSQGSIVIAPAMLTTEGSTAKVDPAVFAAAFALTRLAQAHVGFDGLCGATDWRALGLQYTASKVSKKEAMPLLVEALRRDPSNWLAQVDYANLNWRESEKASDLEHYDVWLKDTIRTFEDISLSGTEPNALLPLLLRIKLTHAAVLINAVFVPSTKENPAKDAREAIRSLCHEAVRASEALKGTDVQNWLKTIQSHASAMVSMLPQNELAGLFDPSEPATSNVVQIWKKLPRTPDAHYSWACAFATPNLTPGDPVSGKLSDEGLQELSQAIIDPEIRAWLAKDPQFDWFRRTKKYDDFRPKPRTDWMAIEPFAAQSPGLKRLGLTDAQMLETTNPDALALQLGLAHGGARTLIGAARIYLSLREHPTLDDVAVEAVEYLHSKLLADPDRLGALSEAQTSTHATKLAETTSPFTGTNEADLTNQYANWINSYPRRG